jgi:uncharacterized protein YraI
MVNRTLLAAGALAAVMAVGAPSADAAQVVFDTEVKSRPDFSAAKVDDIPAGTLVNLGRCVPGDWCKVRWRGGRNGWVVAESLVGDESRLMLRAPAVVVPAAPAAVVPAPVAPVAPAY